MQGPTNSVLSDVGKKAFERKAARKPAKAPASETGQRFDLDEAVTVASGSTAISSWTVFDCSEHLGDARFAVLECYGRNISSPTGAREFKCRRESGAIERLVVVTRGTTTSDITAMVSEATIELTGAKTFEYTTSAMTEYEVRLIGGIS